MANFLFLLESTDPNGSTDWWQPLVLIGVLILVFWFFMYRPQKKQEQKDNAMREALAVGDEVTTIGGIIGKVVSIKGETFVLETTRDKTKIRFLKGPIRSVDVKAEDIANAIIAEEAEKNAPKADAADADNDKSVNPDNAEA